MFKSVIAVAMAKVGMEKLGSITVKMTLKGRMARMRITVDFVNVIETAIDAERSVDDGSNT